MKIEEGTLHVTAEGVAPVHSGRGPLVEFEFFLPVAVFFQGFLLFFIEHEIFQHESIHFRAHETTVGLFRGTDNGLPANIEGGIDQYRALRGFFKLPDQFIEPGIGFGVNRLDAGRIVHMRDRRNL